MLAIWSRAGAALSSGNGAYGNDFLLLGRAAALRKKWMERTLTRTLYTLARVQLCHRHLDSGTPKLLARATAKVAFAYLQSCERERALQLELRRQRSHIGAAAVGPPEQDLGPALPTRIAIGRAMFRGRYRPESDSYSPPRVDSRAR